MSSYQNLHAEDYPQTIKILTELLGHRVDVGIVTSPGGAGVDWAALEQSGLSTTEKAVVEIAHAISVMERGGGLSQLGSIGKVIAESVNQSRH